MSYTLAAAAAACGVNKSTVLRAIKGGKISGTKDEHGEWHVEPAELHRVYPPVADAAAGSGVMPRDATGDAAALAMANQRAALAEERLPELKAMLADMQCDRDAWRDQAQRLALPKPEPEKPMSWWRWLRTTGCLAGMGLLLALSIVPAGAQQQQQQPQRECFTVVAESCRQDHIRSPQASGM
jgi:hypothetical protein